jgi:hypothetical protein
MINLFRNNLYKSESLNTRRYFLYFGQYKFHYSISNHYLTIHDLE